MGYKKYFMHGTSHSLVWTHDVGHWNEPIQAGHVFTVEPGIYIREENLGIRLKMISSSRKMVTLI